MGPEATVQNAGWDQLRRFCFFPVPVRRPGVLTITV